VRVFEKEVIRGINFRSSGIKRFGILLYKEEKMERKIMRVILMVPPLNMVRPFGSRGHAFVGQTREGEGLHA
jgi:hypothetical protein